MVIVPAEQPAVDPEVMAGIERAMCRISEQLRGTNGNMPDPENTLRVLRAILEDRDVPPGRGGPAEIVLGRLLTTLAPRHICAEIAWLPIELLGLMRLTTSQLVEARIEYVGTLLLHTEEELKTRCDSGAVEDVIRCLREYELRLPTREELHEAKEFWVELPDSNSTGRFNLRISRTLAPLVLIETLDELCGSRAGFFVWAKLDTLGDLLGKTEKQLRELWVEYIFLTAGEAEYGFGDPGLLTDEANACADAALAWLKAADLKLLGQ